LSRDGASLGDIVEDREQRNENRAGTNESPEQVEAKESPEQFAGGIGRQSHVMRGLCKPNEKAVISVILDKHVASLRYLTDFQVRIFLPQRTTSQRFISAKEKQGEHAEPDQKGNDSNDREDHLQLIGEAHLTLDTRSPIILFKQVAKPGAMRYSPHDNDDSALFPLLYAASCRAVRPIVTRPQPDDQPLPDLFRAFSEFVSAFASLA